MVTSKNFEMKKEDVVKSPKDEILDAVIIKTSLTTWADIIAHDKLDKFDEPNKEIVQVKYEYKYEDRIFKGEETYAYYEKPMTNSKLGKFLMKYDQLRAGIKIKVVFSSDGFPSIKIE